MPPLLLLLLLRVAQALLTGGICTGHICCCSIFFIQSITWLSGCIYWGLLLQQAPVRVQHGWLLLLLLLLHTRGGWQQPICSSSTDTALA
jgi:hypothetical protein